MALFYLYSCSQSLIVADFVSVESRQFPLLALRPITFTLRCQRVALVIYMLSHVLSYFVFMKFPWKYNFYLLIQLAVPNSELRHLKNISVLLI
jgi:hypothetical protein